MLSQDRFAKPTPTSCHLTVLKKLPKARITKTRTEVTNTTFMIFEYLDHQFNRRLPNCCIKNSSLIIASTFIINYWEFLRYR